MKLPRTSLNPGWLWLLGLTGLALLLPWHSAHTQDAKPTTPLPTQVGVPVPVNRGPAPVNRGPAPVNRRPVPLTRDPAPIELDAAPAVPSAPSAPAILPAIDPASPVPAPAPGADAAPAPAVTAPAAPAAVPTVPAEQPPALPDSNPLPTNGGVLLNFQGASLNDVLNYLSEHAGFVIVQEVPVSGTVNIISRQSVSPDEAVDLLNTVLVEKGFTAIRNGRILKIISRKDAQKSDIPVKITADPQQIPRKDEVVTQILPVKFGEATKLVENLRPLLPDSATITANEASNAILMTDTQTNIRRIAEIIKALDTSVASISTIRVFPLQFADAKEVATMITDLFATPVTATPNAGGGGGRGGRRGGGGFGGFGGPGGAAQQPQSEARQAETKVTAVADEQSNSLIVSAPDAVIGEIQAVISQIDTSITDITTTRIFQLRHADSVELAAIVTSLYSDGTTGPTTTTTQTGRNGGRGGGGGFGGFGAGGARPGAGGQAATSERALLQSKVTAVGDPRTNCLVITASHDSMTKVAELILRLDASDTRRQHVFVHALQHADAENVADVLKGMLGIAVQGTASSNATSALQSRVVNGSSVNAQEVLNTNANASGS